jgi:hypothetical protein
MEQAHTYPISKAAPYPPPPSYVHIPIHSYPPYPPTPPPPPSSLNPQTPLPRRGAGRSAPGGR